jgi:hypothetical protein
LFQPGNRVGELGGRPEGSKDSFPRNSYRAMKELIAGRITKTMRDEEGLEIQRSPAEIMAEAILEGMQGKLVLSAGEKGITYANPLHAVKLYQDYMLKAKELAIRAQEAKKNQTGTGGGIRIVLPSVHCEGDLVESRDGEVTSTPVWQPLVEGVIDPPACTRSIEGENLCALKPFESRPVLPVAVAGIEASGMCGEYADFRAAHESAGFVP